MTSHPLGEPFIGLEEAGRHEVTIVEHDGEWRVRFVDGNPNKFLGFGPALYGGAREQAESDAMRVASKWDWLYLPPELERQADGAIIYTPPKPGKGAGARRDRALLHATYALGQGRRLRLAVAE